MDDSDKVAAVRQLVDAFNRRDLESVVGTLDPAVELREWPSALDAQTYQGRDGARRAMELGQMGTKTAALFHLLEGKVTRLVVYLDRERALIYLRLRSEIDAPGT